MIELPLQAVNWLKMSPGEIKIAAFFGAWLMAWLPIAVPLAIRLKWRPPQPLEIQQKLPLVLSLYALVPLIFWGVRCVENLPLATYGIEWNRSELGAIGLGLAIGVGGVGSLVGLQCALGWASLQPAPSWQSVLVPTLLLGLLVSAVEEAVFRGFLLTQLQQIGLLEGAIVGSSLIFAVLHLVWDGARALPSLPGLWLMGMVLVLARWVDQGRLGLACGLHAGWIWAIASLDALQVIQYPQPSGRQWLTGIGGQPIAGLVGWLLLLATGGLLWGIRPIFY